MICGCHNGAVLGPTCSCLSPAMAGLWEGIVDTWRTLRDMNKRQLLAQVIALGMIITSALVLWKGLMIMTGSESPVVVVLSGSMEPGFQRGDILFLNQQTGVALEDHFRDPGMACGDHRKTRELRFHHRNRVALTVAIGRHHGMLHKTTG